MKELWKTRKKGIILFKQTNFWNSFKCPRRTSFKMQYGEADKHLRQLQPFGC